MSKLSRKRAAQAAAVRYPTTTTTIAVSRETPIVQFMRGARVKIKQVGRYALAPGLPGSHGVIVSDAIQYHSGNSFTLIVQKQWRELRITLPASNLELI